MEEGSKKNDSEHEEMLADSISVKLLPSWGEH
jgi:hypothetical protein